MKRGVRDYFIPLLLAPLIIPAIAGTLILRNWFRQNTYQADILGNGIVAVPEIFGKNTILKVLDDRVDSGRVSINPLTLYQRNLNIQVPRAYMQRRIANTNPSPIIHTLISDADGDGLKDDLQIGVIFPGRIPRFTSFRSYVDVME